MTIERVCNSNSIIYYLPPGKADTEQRREVGPDNRSRVAQKEQKGPNCQYYALALLVGRIGRNCDPSFQKARLAEVASQLRKKSLTTISSSYANCQLVNENYQRACESMPHLNFTVLPTPNLSGENLIRFNKLCELIRVKKKDNPNISVKELIEMEEYKEKIQVQETCIKLLKSDPKNVDLYRQELICAYREDQSVEVPDPTASELQRLRSLFIDLSYYTFKLLLEARGCEPSDWEPPLIEKLDDKKSDFTLMFLEMGLTDGERFSFDKLMDELRRRGPAIVAGYFGPGYYKENVQISHVTNRVGSCVFSDLEAVDMLDRQELENHDYHVVVLLGAEETSQTPPRKVVYFRDPNDASTPECQRIYRLAYSEFCKLVTRMDRENHYLYHYNQPNIILS